MNRNILLATIATLITIPNAATGAEPPAASDGPRIGVGARIGGYGFREVKDGQLNWEDCRMNGSGLFGTLDFTRHVFGEVSADLYHATDGPVSQGMDRTSLHTLAAVGVRMMPDGWLTPYVQAGAGPEFTRVDMNGATVRKVLPEAFMGLGGELNWKQLHFGSTIRFFTMALPIHDHARPAAVETVHQHLEPDQSEPIAMRQEVAAQMLFSLRYHF